MKKINSIYYAIALLFCPALFCSAPVKTPTSLDTSLEENQSIARSSTVALGYPKRPPLEGVIATNHKSEQIMALLTQIRSDLEKPELPTSSQLQSNESKQTDNK